MAKSGSSRSKASSNRKPAGSAPNQKRRAVSPAEKSGKRKLATQETIAPTYVDDGIRRNLGAIACIVVAVALMVIIVWPTDAVVASFLSLSLHRLLGLGAYLLPIMLAAVGIAFVTRFRSQRMPARILVGLLLFYVGLLMLIATFTPGAYVANGLSTDMFSDANVTVRGGYLGAGPAFVSLMLLGFPVTIILSIGIMAAGLVLVGFSLRGIIERLRQRREAARQREDADLSVAPDSPYVPLTVATSRQPSRVIPSIDGEAISGDAPTMLIGQETSEEPTEQRRRPRNAELKRKIDSIEGKRSDFEPMADSRTLTRKLGASQPLDEAIPALEPESHAEPKKTRTRSKATKAKQEELDLRAPDDDFVLPDLSILSVSKAKARSRAFEDELQQTAENLQQTLEDFGIMASVVDWISGPTVTLFEIDLPPGVRVSRITALKDDIALALASPGVRIFAPIPKTHYVGIEVPNSTRQNVLLGDILKQVKGGPLEVAIGKDVEGNAIIEDLAKMPHLLIGGTTGSGKSVGINAMIMSILMRSTPSQVRFIMIDPKRVEFAPYADIPHLYVPVVTEPKEAASALSWGVAEMDLRLKTFSKAGARNIATYNSLVNSGKLRAMVDDGQIDAAKYPQQQYIDTPMPYIVIVIDELSDLMMNVGKEVEFSISRIAQLARAAGIHLIVATQRPSANVVTGLIKANITTRIAYNVASGLDSRVILDTTGAESLIGNGDLLISKPELGRPLRVQGCYTSDDEIAAVVEFLKSQGEPDYHSEILTTNLITLGDSSPEGKGGSSGGDDPLVWEAADIVVSSGMGSTSNIQRKLKVGYARAGRIMDLLEEKGIVGPQNGSKPRDVLVDAMELEALKAFEAADEQGF